MACRTKAVGHVVAACLALWLAAATVFVAPQGHLGAHKAALRGHGSDISPFQASPAKPELTPAISWTSLVSLMAAFGLVVGMATTPVRAEEVAAPVAEAPTPVMKTAAEEAKLDEEKRSKAVSKEDRLKAEFAELREEAANVKGIGTKINESTQNGANRFTTRKGRKETIIREKKEKKEGSTGAGASAAPPVGQLIAYKNKVIISPSDMLDEDELSLARSNPVALFVLATFFPGLYLVFYVLGSLNVI